MTETPAPLSSPPGDNERAPLTLPATAADTSAERPWPVRHLSPKIADYIARLPAVWVEGQVLNVKRWRDLVFLTLRDTDEHMSLSATLPAKAVDALGTDLTDGTRVVIHAKPQWWAKQGTLQMAGRDVRQVGLGDLLARLEALKDALAREGLFDTDRKVPLPFIPRTVGLVCATQGDAEHDVVENATRRWPGVRFEIRRVTVQGARAVPETTAAIRELDGLDRVDVIVVARGGGSFEDLLPFSDEALVRAAAACATPLVSAIGHEKDSPLLDLVADYRASTPTDAGKRIVPDAAAEAAGIARARQSMAGALAAGISRERQALAALRSRPALDRPGTMLEARAVEAARLRADAGHALVRSLSSTEAELRELAAGVRALSPLSTLERGFAVVRDAAGGIVRDAAQVGPGDALRIRVARGEIAADVSGT
ncbi:exodeoxyribonuclease VII large subunit [Demequina sp. SYSU T00068]|uniref:exodeoxyribonuclease VII large subunit n=1 Tax=Demequina lignilytica TaxID=3051663 RepID=UPI00262DB7D6|nr:exodeoxyribonuclease VII large subunit [Demequina sp. SYSU T00068]MDN4490453.1 exodeoxyribonuclease VII large subunit [Demequina sp. SYSU T00068]